MMKLVAGIRTAQSPKPPIPLLFRTPPPLTSRTTGVRFTQSQSDKASHSHQEMDEKDKETNQATGDVTSHSFGEGYDVTSHSFGEGYATRSDDEGFGGIYGGNASTTDPTNQPFKPVIHENHPEYDRSQGSHVSEKEKARNQEKVDH